MSDRPFDQNAPGAPASPGTTPQGVQTPAPGAVTPDMATPLPAAPPPPPVGGDEPSTGDVARQEAASVGQDAKEGAGQVAQTAKEEVQHVAQEAKSQAQSLVSQVQSDVSHQAHDQQQRAAAGLHGLADEFNHMASSEQGGSMAAGLVQQAGQRLDGVADWLERREPADLLEEVKRYARRNPGTFLAICGLVGLVGGRLTRGLRDDATGGPGLHGRSDAPAVPGPTTYQPQADAGVYAAAPGVPTAHATRDYPSDLDTVDQLPTGDDLTANKDGGPR